MANIRVLDQNTINQIAAGEVVERPASVVKELLENAVDARATAVTIEIKEGGIGLIRVTDNGCGIPKEEISTAFLRHATSKIQTVEDLFTVASLGFRGEALSSIASIAQVELITKTGGSMSGARYCIDGGEEKGLEEVGAPDGTTFLVKNLFYNTPARRKFLKSPSTEGAHIADIVEKIALSHPEISIRFIQNGQSRLHTSGNHNLKDIIYTIYGREIASNLLPVEMGEAPVQVKGFIGKPLIARGNRNFENYFINGRYIKSNLIGKAIEDAYKPFMMQHKYPFTMLHFTIEPSFLDVNVHPAKMELRFRDGEMIYKMVYHTISMALSHKELIPEVELEEKKKKEGEPSENLWQERPALKPVRLQHPEPFETRRIASLEKNCAVCESGGEYNSGKKESQPVTPATASDAKISVKPNPGKAETAKERDVFAKTEEIKSVSQGKSLQSLEADTSRAEQMSLFEEKLLTKKARAEHKLIGQLFDTYWLVEYQDSLYIIDQHAAHEKVLYEKTIASLKNREYTSQMINPPVILTLNSSEQLLLERYMEQFKGIGFEIEPFGDREYAVRAVPANLFSIAKKELLMEMIDSLSDGMERGTPEMINDRIASMSCKAAVKGNHRLSETEAKELINQLMELENPYACPHGRPTIISMSRYELEKKFKRIV